MFDIGLVVNTGLELHGRHTEAMTSVALGAIA